jgi:hypothetical protein
VFITDTEIFICPKNSFFWKLENKMIIKLFSVKPTNKLLLPNKYHKIIRLDKFSPNLI